MTPRQTTFKATLAMLAGLSVTSATIGALSGPALAKPAVTTGHGFDIGNLDRSVKPTVDFYKYAIGGWQAKNPIPPEYSSWGSFHRLADQNQYALRAILDQAATNSHARAGTNEQKIGDFYASFMDTARIEAAGIKPLQAELALIDAIQDRKSFIKALGHLHVRGAHPLFNFGSTLDFKDSTQVIAEAVQGGLGMPDRDYYTKDDATSKDLRAAYVKHVAKILELAGDSKDAAARKAQVVMEIETTLAKASMTKVQRRDPNAVYNKKTAAELAALTPDFNWTEYFAAVGRPDLKGINVGQPDFFKVMDKHLTAVALSDWQTYFRWHLLNGTAGSLTEAFVQEDFDFSRKLSGAKVLRPRWKRGVSVTDGHLGEALGQIYAMKHFPPAAKARVLTMIKNINAVLREDLKTLDWMSPATRKAATAKLDTFTVKIGYPDKWRDYSALKIDRTSYVANLLRANAFEWQRDLAKIGKPVDRTEWYMSPPTVNAYYDPTMNEIVFPAGILQPPFFDPQADDAINYGGIGAVIGHEITHGFDDSGAQFDPKGNLSNWWTPEDKTRFEALSSRIADQFDGYFVEKDIHVNGKLVVGESIADLGGLTLAYKALEKSVVGKARPKPIDGFTPEQRFFLGYAQVWASNSRPEYTRTLINTDPHPPAQFRVNGPLSNLAFFAKAFGARAGDPMVRKEASLIW
ncbi:MAG: M13 family metallopeptidase [Candidatus Sericytochromatia bacterium]|nr:M13 family metallopeptidase [Candidatus Sericytochromatia bacterium]